MAIDLSAISSATTTATALSNLILVSPQGTTGYQPQNKPTKDGTTPPQPPTLVFQYEGEQNLSVTSDITDHYVEDNTAIQDQIALRPDKFTTHGFVGELNDVAPAALALLQTAASKLTVIDAYTPVLSETAIIAYNEAAFAYQVAANAINSAVSTWSSINGGGSENVIDGNGIVGGFNSLTGAVPNASSQTKQQLMFQQFYGYIKNRTLFKIQTPWAIFENMAIETFRAVQEGDTRVITDFEVTFKAMRFASTITIAPTAGVFDGRGALQSAPLTNLGTSTPPQFGTTFSQEFQNNYPSFNGTGALR